ncbi:hypothetical protein SmB9_38100 [Sphingosinicella microcystinivorans]|uniref:Uncharacterized protein n=1 Tax=Sphingosinicella microcystinivorans TaxID=335406 RepID=A0AAD1DA18_SPHMI|nr:hypothetical protein [Sphingosinicella microcystinivorans]BBE36152.1 hypothetical protein SmB9_38100 [Sphingosinicella microcystinivorans]
MGWGASARAGFKINDATGLYGRSATRQQDQRRRREAWGDGVRFGGGVETAISDTASLRAEFNHVNFEDDVINNQGVIGVLFASDDHEGAAAVLPSLGTCCTDTDNQARFAGAKSCRPRQLKFADREPARRRLRPVEKAIKASACSLSFLPPS